MALTSQELEQWVNSKIDTSIEPDWGDQNDVSLHRSVHVKYDYQLQDLEVSYSQKIWEQIKYYENTLKQLTELISGINISAITLKGSGGYFQSKVMTIAEKWLAVKREVEGRQKGYFNRNPVGTDYYIDFTNGSNSSPHDGLRYPTTSTYTADAGTSTTQIVETSELGRSTNGDWNGAYLYNVTRGEGRLITGSTYAAGTWTLTHSIITGQVSTDTYYIIDAWATLEQYTSVTARSPGDIVYVRANMTQINSGVELTYTDDGNGNNLIYIIGCDSVNNDPWVDGSDVLPIYDFNAGAFRSNAYADNYWSWQRLCFRNSIHGIQMFNLASGVYGELIGCELKDYNSPGDPALAISTCSVFIKDCLFHDNDELSVRVEAGDAYLIGCVFNGGGGNEKGLESRSGANAYCVDCDFGQTTPHGVADFATNSNGRIFERNCNWNSGTPSIVPTNYWGRIAHEDKDETYGSHLVETSAGNIEKNITILRSGGGVSSIKITCSSFCNEVNPLQLSSYEYLGEFAPLYPYKIWCSASQKTITMYIRGLSWTGFPTAPQLYIEASYLDHLTNATRTKIKSNDVLVDNTTWIAFDVTFTPQQEGFVYLNIFLRHYEIGCGIYVDIKPIVS